MRVFVLCFIKMLVNLTQYSLTVVIFNNCHIIVSLHYEASFYSGISNNLFNGGSSYFSLMFYFFFYVLFLSNAKVLKSATKFCVPFFLFNRIVACVLVCLCSLLLMLSGEIEIKPRVFKWNLNSISGHDSLKLFLLKAYIILHKTEIIWLSETHLILLLPPMMTNYIFLGTLRTLWPSHERFSPIAIKRLNN